ncbi:hypothetical protein WJX73_005022 [Symbiochloris irregularis]|uniref:Rab-GAP TBC domain-containing protein n=1 Tax=Symbiochloris irregularis TaxID=706552 RepID=A0AAW1PB96_9CHLO
MDLGACRYGMSLVGLTNAEAMDREACVTKEEKAATKWLGATELSSWAWSSTTQAPPKALKLLVREGIPPALRPSLWLRFSGGLTRQRAAPAGYYASLAEHNVSRVSPPLDVDARFAETWTHLHPGHLLLNSSAYVAAVQRMTAAYVNYADSVEVSDATLRYVGCCSAFLLTIFGVKQEEAAWFTLLALVEDRLPASFITQEDAGYVEQRMLEQLLVKQCPRVRTALAQNKLDFEDLTGGWFPCLFACTLPVETSARVWDCLLCEGPKVMFRVAVALFKMNEAALVTPGYTAARNFKWRVARTYAADTLLQMAFQGIGSFPMARVASMRRAQSGSVPPQLQAAEKTSPRTALTRLTSSKLLLHVKGPGSNASSSGDLGALDLATHASVTRTW